MMQKDHLTIQVRKRESAYESFRNFIHDPQQKGETLLSVAPPKLGATKSLMSKRAFITRLAYRPDAKIAGTSLLVPSEILWAAGYTPFNWEMFSSLIASHSRVIELTNKGSAPVPRCSFINSLKGAVLEEILPVPNITVSSSAFCEGISHMISEVSMKFKVPHFHLDIPGYRDELSVSYLATQLEEIFNALTELNGTPAHVAAEGLHEAFRNSVMAKSNYQAIMDIRKRHAPLDLGLEPLHWHAQFAPFWGDHSGVSITRRLLSEISDLAVSNNKDESRIPVAMFGLIPYGRSDVWSQLSEAGAYFTFEGVNYLGEYDLPDESQVEQMETREIFRHLAQQMIAAPVRGLDFEKKARMFVNQAVASGAKGIIIFSHEHCQMLAARLNAYEQTASEHGLKFVSISGDCILGMPKGPTGLRLGTFLTELKGRSPGDHKARQARRHAFRNTGHADVHVGIDFGSGFSKYIAIDPSGQVLQKGLFTSGIDYPHLLNEIMERLSDYKNVQFALAGVGSDNNQLFNRVHNQTTEINALIVAVRSLFGHLDRFLVVDIGTQDVKVVKFYSTDSAPWINTNKSCGAGTGMVLVQILERWKQSQPGITFDDIDQMALSAHDSELINTTCGIFAVTNVVSALIQSEEERRNEILRGVYHYIASQAIKLLPNETNTDYPLLLVGGVGRHRTLRQLFVDKGFDLLELPDEIPLQHLIAYGTALTLFREQTIEKISVNS